MKTRRQFIQSASAALAGGAFSPLMNQQVKAGISPNEKIGIALIEQYSFPQHLF